MSKVIRAVVGAALVVAGALTGSFQLILAGVSLVGGALLQPSISKNRAAAAAQLQLGEQPRQAVLGRSAVAGSLVDAFNYGGKYGTDWEVLVIALADHRCDALEGFFVDDTYVAFSGDGNVAGFNNQLQVFWRSGTWNQTVPSILTANGPGWTANDRGRGVAYVVVAYKADAADAKNPVWPSGRPRFRWVVRGLRCYQPRKDSTVGGSGAHRRNDPATWEWTENPIDIRYNWVRGIYAGDLVDQPGMLLIGRGLSAIEAPPANVFARANLCDEVVAGSPRYRIGGVVSSTESFIEVESDFAAAVAGTISQPQGAVEVDPGQAKAPIAHFTDADLLVGSKVSWNEGILGQQDDGWVNTVAPRFVDPAQRWTMRSAPVQRDLADVVADGGPRESQPQLDFVTSGPQAQRVGQVIRRLGRLWGRAQVTLPPRFAFIEEGDWVTWQSDRYFGGATLTFRVEAWGSDAAWHHQLTLRQISASVFSDTAPLDDGSVASTQAAPPLVAAPGPAAWNLAAVLLGSGPVRVPNLRVSGAVDDPAATFIVFEYVQQNDAPTPTTNWTFAASSRPDTTLLDIAAPEGGTFWVAVSYVVDGILGERRVLGPVSTSSLAFSDGSPVAPTAPANSNLVPFSRMEGDRGWAINYNPSNLSASLSYGSDSGRRFVRATVTATAANQDFAIGGPSTSAPQFPLVPGSRVSVQARAETTGVAGGPWRLALTGFTAAGTQSEIASVSGSGLRALTAAPLQMFVDVPSNIVGGRLEFYCRTTGAGSFTVALAEPMVAYAAAGQNVHPPFTPGPNADDAADVTAPNQRTIVPQFPVIEISRGDPGNVGDRTVTHSARRGTTTLSGGSWSLTNVNLGTGSANVNVSTGTVTLSGIVQSGSYTIRYTHTDGYQTDLAVNVLFVPVTVSVLVTNEAHVVPTAADGTGGNYTNAGGTMSLLRGDTALAATYSIASKSPNTNWITINSSTGVYTVTDPGVDAATATLRATWQGVNYDRIYTLAKSKAGATGAAGSPGLTTATVFIYRRSASQPALPTTTATYTFADGTITGLNNGWTRSVPSGTDPLWVAVATASGTGTTDTIASNEWSSPVILAQDGAPGAAGAPGAPGLNSAVVFIYQRAASAPAAPTSTTTYTFATGAITGLNNDWSATVPNANGQPLWVRQASASGTGTTDTIAPSEWSAAAKLTEDGAAGAAGGNAAVVFIYQRAASAPAAPSTTATYTFATGAISGLNNGWSATVPAANGSPLWVRTAVAFSTGTTDTIASNEWSSASILAQDGAQGPAGLNSASVFLYRRSASQPALPTTTATYTFATGVLTGHNNSWTQSVPSGSDPLWVITASAASTSATDTIASNEWSSPVILAQDGAQGPAGPALVLLADTQAFTFTDGAANPTSQTITLTAQLQNISGTVSWSTTPSVTLGGSGNTRTLTVANFGSNRQVTVEATLNGITDRITLVRVDRDVTAPANSNLVPFSRMEGDRGWGVNYNPSSLAATATYGTADGRRFFRASVTATAANQDFSIGATSNAVQQFPLVPGSRVSVQARAETTGVAAGPWRLSFRGFTAAGAQSEIASVSGSGLRALTAAPLQMFVDVPSNIVGGRLEFYCKTTGSGTFTVALAEPMVAYAAAGQNVHPPFTPGPNAEDAADVTALAQRTISGPTAVSFTYTSTGTLDPSAQMPADLIYTLSNQSGPITSGVTWQYRIIEGNVNGFAASSTLRSMSGSGQGTLTISSLAATSRVEIVATEGGRSVSVFATLTRVILPPNSGGGGGAQTATQTSGFSNVTSSSYATISNELEVTAGTTTQTVTTVLTFSPPNSGISSSTIEVQVERWNGSSWVAMGSSESASSSRYYDAEVGQWLLEPAVFNFQRTATITSGTAQKARVRARRSSGTVTHSVTGTFTLSA